MFSDRYGVAFFCRFLLTGPPVRFRSEQCDRSQKGSCNQRTLAGTVSSVIALFCPGPQHFDLLTPLYVMIPQRACGRDSSGSFFLARGSSCGNSPIFSRNRPRFNLKKPKPADFGCFLCFFLTFSSFSAFPAAFCGHHPTVPDGTAGSHAPEPIPDGGRTGTSFSAPRGPSL